MLFCLFWQLEVSTSTVHRGVPVVVVAKTVAAKPLVVISVAVQRAVAKTGNAKKAAAVVAKAAAARKPVAINALAPAAKSNLQ